MEEHLLYDDETKFEICFREKLQTQGVRESSRWVLENLKNDNYDVSVKFAYRITKHILGTWKSGYNDGVYQEVKNQFVKLSKRISIDLPPNLLEKPVISFKGFSKKDLPTRRLYKVGKFSKNRVTVIIENNGGTGTISKLELLKRLREKSRVDKRGRVGGFGRFSSRDSTRTDNEEKSKRI
jgi:hypothetical protein